MDVRFLWRAGRWFAFLYCLPRFMRRVHSSKTICALVKNSPQDCFCPRSERLRAPLSAHSPSSLFRRAFLIKQTGYPTGYPVCFGAPEETRTPDLLIRSQTLYPAELPAHVRSLERKIYNTILFKKKQVFFEKLIHLSD